MKIPARNSAAYRLAEYIYKQRHPISVEEANNVITSFGYSNKTCSNVLTDMRHDGQIVGEPRKECDLSIRFYNYFYGLHEAEACASRELVPSRTPNPFRPLSAKYIPSAKGPREEAHESRSFFVSGTAPEARLNGVRL